MPHYESDQNFILNFDSFRHYKLDNYKSLKQKQKNQV
jgi:hypothetical protein